MTRGGTQPRGDNILFFTLDLKAVHGVFKMRVVTGTARRQ